MLFVYSFLKKTSEKGTGINQGKSPLLRYLNYTSPYYAKQQKTDRYGKKKNDIFLLNKCAVHIGERGGDIDSGR